MQNLHLLLRVAPAQRAHDEEVARQRADYEARIAHVLDYNANLQVLGNAMCCIIIFFRFLLYYGCSLLRLFSITAFNCGLLPLNNTNGGEWPAAGAQP